MAITYTYEDVITAVARNFPRMVESDSGALVANQAIYEIWKRYDWRESLAVLPPFYLIPNEQDHGRPAVTVPADFLGLRMAYLTRLNSTPAYRSRIQPVKDLELTDVRGLPTCMGYETATRCFRVFPRVPVNMGAPDWIVQGEYKTRPTKLTATIMSSTLLPFDDIHVYNMMEVFKWSGLSLAGDPRAGGVQMNSNGAAQYVGQYAIAMHAIDQMAETEGLELGDVVLAPSEPLVNTSRTMWGTYGNIFGY